MAQKPLDKSQIQEAVDVLALHAGNRTRAAASLGIPCGTFDNRLRAAKIQGIKAEELDKIDTAAHHQRIKIASGKRTTRYVITSAQNATPVHKGFFASLLTYCKHTKAHLVVIPFRYSNPTSIWSAKAKHEEWWDKATLPFLLDQRVDLNKNLVLMADVKMQPTATRPLSGMDTMSGSKSAILAHPKLELTTVPTPSHKMPKIITTTGACTKQNYTESKAGKKGVFHHAFGACVVEVDGDIFHMRQINAVRDGSFIDLDYEYTADGRSKVDSIEALVMGDTHQEFVDPEVIAATFGKGGIVPSLKPKLVVWHDLHDFYSRNHHHKHAVFINFAKHHAGTNNVREALEATFRFVDEQTAKHTGQNVFVPSNHPDALNRWVQETDPREDPENAIFWAQTFSACCEGAKMTKSGASTIDPFVYWAKRMMKSLDRTIFLRRDESLQVKGIELGYHGDKGPNGSRGSIGGFTRIGVKSIIGHSHTPGIRDGVFQVGLNSYYALEYQSGPSSWLQTDCVVYRNGKRSLINFVGGKWRA